MSNATPIITLWQPWATWIAIGEKGIESRTHDKYKGLVGKRIGIHAGMKMDKDAPSLAGEFAPKDIPFPHVHGAIICTAEVVAHRKLTALDAKDAMLRPLTCERRYGLFLEDIMLIEPFFVKGKQGIWYSPEFDEWFKKQS